MLVYVSVCFICLCMCLCAVAYWGSSSTTAAMISFQRSTYHPFSRLPPATIAKLRLAPRFAGVWNACMRYPCISVLVYAKTRERQREKEFAKESAHEEESAGERARASEGIDQHTITCPLVLLARRDTHQARGQVSPTTAFIHHPRFPHPHYSHPCFNYPR